ncbi:MAG: HEPN domain-containing protein [Acidobacteriota bacterium]|nr:HEPN domain-containing protein [Acidobacteriota bacterium]
MKINNKIVEHFEQLVRNGEGAESLRQENEFNQFLSEWKHRSVNIVETIFGRDSSYFKTINSEYEGFGDVEKAVGALKAAYLDYKDGLILTTRTLIEAEVFDEFLEQAEELFKKSYYQAAAVIAGCVLEDSLRKLGQRKIPNFPTDKTIDPMNIELAKAGIYNALWQKKITVLADLRNKAAHGKWTEFTEKDVEDMIRDVRRFMEDYFS